MILVDDEDKHLLINHKWRINRDGYAVKMIDRKVRYIHRVITNCPDNKIVDHINGDKLDNRRSNLRICTPAQNACNTGLRKDNKSGYKGVLYVPRRGKYRAQIRHNGKRIYLGATFLTAEEAYEAYKTAAIKYHKEFARL